MKCGLEVVPRIFLGRYECLEPDVGFAAIFEVFAERVNTLEIRGIVFELGAFESL